MSSIRSITGALSLVCALSAPSAIDQNMINFQSGIDLGGTYYAGGMTYEAHMKLRIQARFEQDDIIQSICLHPADEEGSVPYVYVVGSKEIQMQNWKEAERNTEDESSSEKGLPDAEAQESCYGFVKKVDLRTMTVMWEGDIHGGHIKAMDCAVTDDGETLYVTGTTGNGESLSGWESNGGEDIWVRQYGTMGDARWEIQLGSDEDESLAKGGAIEIDGKNNAIIYGNTRGSMGLARDDELLIPDDTNDIFVMTVSFDGAYLAPHDKPIFQIQRRYLEDRARRHKPLILSLYFVSLAVFAFVVRCESKWQRIPVADFLRDVMPDLPKKRASNDEDTKRAGGDVSKPVDLTEEESGEEDDAVLTWLCSNPAMQSQRTRERDSQEQKTEMA